MNLQIFVGSLNSKFGSQVLKELWISIANICTTPLHAKSTKDRDLSIICVKVVNVNKGKSYTHVKKD